MKKTILIICTLLVCFFTEAQEKSKNAKISFEVNGVCEMCKARIEKAALKTKGVKYANWNIDTHQLQLIINEQKVDALTIQKNIANAGHDTENVKATNDAYENLHSCCKYDREDFPLLKDETKNN